MSDDPHGHSIGQRVLTSTLWLAAWRWAARLMGIASIIVLARLLLPDDFGVVATGMVVVGFFDILIDLGTDRYLIRLSTPSRGDYDTAWTLRLMVVAGASTTICLAAGPIAALFGDERLLDVLRVLALASLLRGFSNIGLIMYQRDLRFGRIAMIGLGQRFIGVVTTITLAFILQSYWAMVLGHVAFRIAELTLSYMVHPYRPRLSTSHIADQWNFSKWIVVRNVATFLQGRGDQLIVAKLFGTEAIGLYSMAVRIAQLPTRNFMKPVILPLYSGLAKKQHYPEQFTLGVLQMTGATFAVVTPAATLFATLSDPLVAVALGSKWLAVGPLLTILVLAIMVQVLVDPVVTTLTLLGRVGLLAALHWVSAIVGVGLLVVAASLWELEQVAQTRAAVAAALSLVYYGYLHAAMGISWGRLLDCVYRPGMASAAMAAVTIPIANTAVHPSIVLILAFLAGITTYISVIYGLWYVTGKPNSGEAVLVRHIRRLARRIVDRRG